MRMWNSGFEIQELGIGYLGKAPHSGNLVSEDGMR